MRGSGIETCGEGCAPRGEHGEKSASADAGLGGGGGRGEGEGGSSDIWRSRTRVTPESRGAARPLFAKRGAAVDGPRCPMAPTERTRAPGFGEAAGYVWLSVTPPGPASPPAGTPPCSALVLAPPYSCAELPPRGSATPLCPKRGAPRSAAAESRGCARPLCPKRGAAVDGPRCSELRCPKPCCPEAAPPERTRAPGIGDVEYACVRVRGLGLRVEGFGFGVQGLGEGLVFGFWCWDVGFGVWGLGCGIWVKDFGFGFRV